MQEEVENRTVNLAISTTKLTARSLLNAFRAYMNHRRNVKAKKTYNMDTHIVGEQTIGQLLGQNQGATNIEIEKTEISGFKRILNKYGVDYAITKDKSQVPPRYCELSSSIRGSVRRISQKASAHYRASGNKWTSGAHSQSCRNQGFAACPCC